jgi:hypothetical protein
MAISQYEFWYDRQQVRMLEQLVRAFSGFSYQPGSIGGATPQNLLVPCRIASMNRVVNNLASNVSENTLLAVPLITVYQTGLRGRKEDLQNPSFVDNLQVFERKIGTNGRYGPERGNAYSVDRIMPLPFTMECEIDIWTSNLQQKYMLIEQMLPIMYPQFEIQNSDNALDWTAVTICIVDDDFSFSSRTIPIGTSDEIDVMSIKVHIPIWLSAPAKVKRLTRIEEVVANVNAGAIDPATGVLQSGERLHQSIITPGDRCLYVEGSTLTLLAAESATLDSDGSVPSWQTLITQYGLLRPTISQIKLFITDDIEGPFVSGTLQFSGTTNKLIWTIDTATLPANTLPAVDAVINPLVTFPGAGLPTVADGQRYMIMNDLGNSQAWGTLNAQSQDIIQYGSGTWTVAFDASAAPSQQYMVNSFTNRQLFWNGSVWAIALDGFYHPGYWNLIL